MLYLGLVAGVVVGNAAAHAAGIDAPRVFIADLILIGPALMGARLLHVVAHWRLYRPNLRRIWSRGDSGASQYGGLALVVPLSVPLLAALDVPFGAFWDATTPAVLVGMIFVRIGCLMNGCCAGRPSGSWISVHLPNRLGVWDKRIPTQGLEAGWAAILLVFAIAAWHSLPFPGALFLIVTVCYASGRLLLSMGRERYSGATGLAVRHGISVTIIVSSLAVLMACWPE